MSNDFSIENKLKELKPSIVRTLVPIVMALAAYLGLSKFIDTETLSFIISSVITLLYYSIARFLEIKNSKWSVLLGSKSIPNYSGTASAVQDVYISEDAPSEDAEDSELETALVDVQEIKEVTKPNRLETEQEFINDFILGQE